MAQVPEQALPEEERADYDTFTKLQTAILRAFPRAYISQEVALRAIEDQERLHPIFLATLRAHVFGGAQQ
jgi:hypothetical protein